MDESLVVEYPDLEQSHFWWVTRRLLVAKLVESLDLPARHRVLDVGCGAAVTARMLEGMGAEVVGIDSSPVFAATEGANKISQFVVGDYIELSPTLGQFNLTMALDSVEHFSDERAVLSAIAQNTLPGGVVIVTVPAYRWLWSSHDEENEHYRRYTRKRLRQALEQSGLNVERTGYVFASLVPPKALLAGLEKIVDQRMSTGTEIPRLSNCLARTYFGWEAELALRLKGFLPFGTSVVALARRSDPQHTKQSGETK